MVRKKKEFRELKVSSFGGYGCKTAPMLRLQGLWLEQCGFNIGDPILVKCEDGKLTITLDEERAFVEEHKKAFLECEMQDIWDCRFRRSLRRYWSSCMKEARMEPRRKRMVMSNGI